MNRAECECGKIMYCNKGWTAWLTGLIHLLLTGHEFEPEEN